MAFDKIIDGVKGIGGVIDVDHDEMISLHGELGMIEQISIFVALGSNARQHK